MTSSRISFPAAALLLSLAVPASARLLDITRHGAKPNDEVDDASAIQAALDAAADGDTVFVPAGEWLVGSTLLPPSRIRLLGTGAPSKLVLIEGAAVPILRITSREGVRVERLAFVGNDVTPNMVQASSSSDLRFQYLAFSGLGGIGTKNRHGLQFTSNVTDSYIADNTFDSMAVADTLGGAIRVSQGSKRNKILRNTIKATGRGGILADNGSTRLLINGNRVSRSGLADGGKGKGLGIEIWAGCDSSVIEDNVLDHWLSVDHSPFTAVRRNTVATADGTYKDYGLELASAGWCVFTGNSTGQGSKVGLSVSNQAPKEHVYWGGNTFAAATTWGAQIQSDAGGARYHYFHGNTFKDMPLDHPQAKYKGQGHGLRFNGNGPGHHMTLDGNTFSGNAGAAIQWVDQGLDRFRVFSNVFAGNARVTTGTFPGAYLFWSATSNTVSGPGDPAQPASKGTFSPAPKPTISFSGPRNPGRTLTFTAVNQAGGGDMAAVLWDFGEGFPRNEIVSKHAYGRTGEFRVTLIVWSSQGVAARAHTTVTVVDMAAAAAAGAGAPGVRPEDGRVRGGTAQRGARRYDLSGRALPGI